MRATVSLDDELVKTAQELSGVTEITALLKELLRALIHREASRSLAALGGTMSDLEHVRRLRVDEL
jgi:Arc/MetJ family transcription regulator